MRVTPDAQRRLRQGHPWLYDQSIRRQSHEGQPGDLAVIFEQKTRRFLAIGLYDPTSPIRVRVLQARHPAPIDRAWYQRRLEEAIRRRTSLVESRVTTAYRLVHGENDGLPGLVIDRYEQTVVLKLYTVAWIPRLEELIEALLAVFPAQRLVLRLSRSAQQQSGYLQGLADGALLFGPPLDGPLTFLEHGLRFEVDPLHGQKTGFFLDQRENRTVVERFAGGADVLDAFAYTGGFSVYAARGGAHNVMSLEMIRPVVDALRRNMALNRGTPAVAAARHTVVVGDVFEKLARLRSDQRSFDVVILDPPAFATSQADVSSALTTYERLTRMGLNVLRPGGTLVFSCCSSQIKDQWFFSAVHRAASRVGRPLHELARTGHPLDHPIGFPEGAYLKCLFARAPAFRINFASRNLLGRRFQVPNATGR